MIFIDFSPKFEQAVAEIFKVHDQLNPRQIAHMHAELSGGLLFMLTRAHKSLSNKTIIQDR